MSGRNTSLLLCALLSVSSGTACRDERLAVGTSAEHLAWVRLHLPSGTESERLRIVSEHDEPPRHREIAPDGSLLLAWATPPGRSLRIEVSGRGICPLRIEAKAGSWTEAKATPWIQPPPPLDRVGFGRPFTLRLLPGCREAITGRVRWRILRGPRIPLHPEAHGFRLSGRLPDASATGALEHAPRWGIVPLTPRTRGEVVLEGTWRGPPPHDGMRLQVVVAATDRANGVPSLAPTQQIWLAGSGWRVLTRPRDARGTVTPPRQGLPWSRFEPDRSGSWLLRDETGRPLQIRVGRFEETRLDCGRSGCHQEAVRDAAETAMTASWLRFVERHLEPGEDPRCGLGCHAAGTPGHPDGSLAELATTHGWRLRRGRTAWHALPPLLRRVAGVGCQGCHGPGAIPSEHERWTILRAEVCGSCHDAPPRYGHLIAWRTSRMARADAHEGVTAASCRGCHTTDGFLERLGRPSVHVPPPEARPLGIACAACHAPHAPDRSDHLLRRPPLPETLRPLLRSASDAERLCAGCHGGGLENPDVPAMPAPSRSMRAPGEPHAAVPGGCTGCHRGGPTDVELGRGHAFAPDRGVCTNCHRGEEARLQRSETDWKRRRTALLARGRAMHLVPKGEPTWWHTTHIRSPNHEGMHEGGGTLGARRDELVRFLADPAHWVHAPRDAWKQLAALEQLLDPPPPAEQPMP